MLAMLLENGLLILESNLLIILASYYIFTKSLSATKYFVFIKLYLYMFIFELVMTIG